MKLQTTKKKFKQIKHLYKRKSKVKTPVIFPGSKAQEAWS